jgi:hypothetical protein
MMRMPPVVLIEVVSVCPHLHRSDLQARTSRYGGLQQLLGQLQGGDLRCAVIHLSG